MVFGFLVVAPGVAGSDGAHAHDGELLAERIVAEGLSVRSTEEIVRLGNAPTEEEQIGRAHV